MPAPPDPTVPQVVLVIAIALGCCLGVMVTLLWKWNTDNAEIEALGAENRLLRKRLAHTLCRYRERNQAVKRLQKFVDRNWYAEVGEVDEYLMRNAGSVD